MQSRNFFITAVFDVDDEKPCILCFFVSVVMVVFDVTNIVTLAHTAQWLEEAKQANEGSNPLIFLVGTKRDLMVRLQRILV